MAARCHDHTVRYRSSSRHANASTNRLDGFVAHSDAFTDAMVVDAFPNTMVVDTGTDAFTDSVVVDIGTDTFSIAMVVAINASAISDAEYVVLPTVCHDAELLARVQRRARTVLRLPPHEREQSVLLSSRHGVPARRRRMLLQ